MASLCNTCQLTEEEEKLGALLSCILPNEIDNINPKKRTRSDKLLDAVKVLRPRFNCFDNIDDMIWESTGKISTPRTAIDNSQALHVMLLEISKVDPNRATKAMIQQLNTESNQALQILVLKGILKYKDVANKGATG